MAWDPINIAGLQMWSLFNHFTDFQAYASLYDEGYHDDPPQSADFSWDDTLFGQLPDGVMSRLASCCGGLFQPIIYPVAYLGADAGTPQTDSSIGGTMTAFSCHLAGAPVDVADDDLSRAAGGLVRLASALPRAFKRFSNWPVYPSNHASGIAPTAGIGPYFYVLRPEPLYWASQDPGNDANRTIWQASEITGVLSCAFTVLAPSALLAREWTGRGWRPV